MVDRLLEVEGKETRNISCTVQWSWGHRNKVSRSSEHHTPNWLVVTIPVGKSEKHIKKQVLLREQWTSARPAIQKTARQSPLSPCNGQKTRYISCNQIFLVILCYTISAMETLHYIPVASLKKTIIPGNPGQAKGAVDTSTPGSV